MEIDAKNQQEQGGVREALKQAKRIVIKIGTSSLVHAGGKMNLRRIEKLARVISELMNQGREIILVSSGAIGVGAEALKLRERPSTVSGRQAAAAVGQVHLMQVYSRLFAEYGYNVAQILLTRDTVDAPEAKQNAVNTFTGLIEMHVLPVVNENDTIAVDEIKFGDNDNLSSIVARITGADLLIILTDIDGYYKDNPADRPDAEMYHNITDLSEAIETAAGGAGSRLGTGGMLTKVHASRLAAAAGIHAVIANGSDPEILYRILDGEDVGTMFVGKTAQ
ncbi:MAG: glutamate 5-kinase [Clostridia bacterium]|nr:glutamate 5-kinase [Clostridia bacterium]MBQ3868164.1 glutamate 5-kinase [Clostridia bacterium]MBR0158630.1 glutamate 5-kinase [Clostridia bacterium]MBR7063490.1 glutamate 5-kinase [Clostridia bacterium]